MMEKIIYLLVGSVFGFYFSRKRDREQMVFNKKLLIYSGIIEELSKYHYILEHPDKDNKFREKLISLFSPARLIGSKELETELREYFSLVVEYFETLDEKTKKDLMGKISETAMEIEQIMRGELVNNRVCGKKK